MRGTAPIGSPPSPNPRPIITRYDRSTGRPVSYFVLAKISLASGMALFSYLTYPSFKKKKKKAPISPLDISYFVAIFFVEFDFWGLVALDLSKLAGHWHSHLGWVMPKEQCARYTAEADLHLTRDKV